VRLAGKVAVVTGGARGIGLAIAKRFHQEAAKVVIADTDERSGIAAAEEVGSELFKFCRCDVTNAGDVNLLMQTASAWGRLDICVSNAAIIGERPFLELNPEEFSRVLDVNVKGTLLVGQAAARAMIAQGTPGSIINMSSGAAEVVMPDLAAYASSKGAVRQLTKVMAIALAPAGIRVNAIGPGSVQTDMFDALMAKPGSMERVLSRTPARRVGTVEEIAGVAMFLATEDSAYVYGQTIYVDGGRLILNYMV